MSGQDHRFLTVDKASQLKGAVDHKRTGAICIKLGGSVDFHQRISRRRLRIGAKFILLLPPIVSLLVARHRFFFTIWPSLSFHLLSQSSRTWIMPAWRDSTKALPV